MQSSEVYVYLEISISKEFAEFALPGYYTLHVPIQQQYGFQIELPENCQKFHKNTQITKKYVKVTSSVMTVSSKNFGEL